MGKDIRDRFDALRARYPMVSKTALLKKLIVIGLEKEEKE
jgi:hypothetical protein